MNERTENVYENKGPQWKTLEPRVGVVSQTANLSTHHPNPCLTKGADNLAES
jgi:hypothetical protein